VEILSVCVAVEREALPVGGGAERAAGHRFGGVQDDAVSVVRTRMQPSIDRLEADGITEGVPRSIAYNETAAGEWADEACPGGPARQFGDCEAIDGVVVQDRVGETHVLAAAFDVRVTTESGTTSLTVVVRVSE